MMFFFFPLCLVFFRHCDSFLSCQVCWARASSLCFSLSLSGRLHLHFCISLYFHYPSVSCCLALIHFHRLLLPLSPISLIFASRLRDSLSFLHLDPFDQVPVCTFSFPPLLRLLLLCIFWHLSPNSYLKAVFTLDCCDAPRLLNRWRGYFYSSPHGHQTRVCASDKVSTKPAKFVNAIYAWEWCVFTLFTLVLGVRSFS